MHPQQTDRMSGRCSRKSTGRDGRRQEKKHTVGFVEMTEKKGKLPPRKVRQFPGSASVLPRRPVTHQRQRRKEVKMKGKRKTALLLCMAMVFTLISPGQIQAKAKKPALSKKKVEIMAGKKTTIKVKRGKKAAKVSWKTSKKSVVKIVKKTKKGNKARATIKGVRAGKAKITAVYKLGKKKTKLTCKVTVKAKDSGTDKKPTGSPSGNTSGKPTGSPSGSPSTAPTQKPSGSPSTNPSTVPSTDPSTVPSTDPSTVPSVDPSTVPSTDPSTAPSVDPSTEPSTDPSTSPSEDPSASPSATPVDETHDAVNISKDNVAFADTETEEYKDGTATVGLSSKSSGVGICFYLNDEHTSVDMAKYKNLKIEYETEKAYKMAVSLKNNIPASAASSYWDGADSDKCPLVGSEQYATFSKGTGTYTLNLSNITAAAQGVFIKYNTYNEESTADPIATITIKSIKLEKDPTYVPPVPIAEKEISLTQDSLAYSTESASVQFEGGKMIYDSTAGSSTIGLYINSDKSKVPYDKYKAIKIDASTESGGNFGWYVSYVGGEITSTSTSHGGGTTLNQEQVIVANGSEILLRTDIIKPTTLDLQPACVLEIRSSKQEKYTINSIKLLEECPGAESDINIDISEENIAFSTVTGPVEFKDGRMEVTMKKGEQIGFYLKDDHSEVDLYDYYAVDFLAPDTEKGARPNTGFAAGVTDKSAAFGGGAKAVASVATTAIRDNTYSYKYWKYVLMRTTGGYAVTKSATKIASVMYIECSNAANEKKIVIDGIRLRKREYANRNS